MTNEEALVYMFQNPGKVVYGNDGSRFRRLPGTIRLEYQKPMVQGWYPFSLMLSESVIYTLEPVKTYTWQEAMKLAIDGKTFKDCFGDVIHIRQGIVVREDGKCENHAFFEKNEPFTLIE